MMSDNLNTVKLTVIIPTYNNLKFLPECLNSVLNSMKNYDCEVLIGIDNCEETLNYISGNSFDNRFKFYFFEKRLGPYAIKNTLSNISLSENLLFFDSDDIMDESCIPEIIYQILKFDLIKIKYLDFQNDAENLNKKQKISYGEGVFAIKKSIFLSMNGFYPWMCAADSEFMSRIYKRTKNIFFTNKIMFNRRVHSDSLTQNSETGLASKMRASFINSVKHRNGPDSLFVFKFKEINIKNRINEDFVDYTHRKTETADLLNNTIKLNVLDSKNGVDYNKINEVVKKREEYSPENKLNQNKENPPKNRNKLNEIKNGSIADMSQKMMGKSNKKKNNAPNISGKIRRRF